MVLLQNAHVFEASELDTLQTNITLIQIDICQQYRETLDRSHHGHPTIVWTVHSGCRGRPRIQIDSDFLRWAYAHRSVAGISWFLHVGRNAVRNALIEYGIAEPQDNPFPIWETSENERIDSEGSHPVQQDDFLDPSLSPTDLPDNVFYTNPNNVPPTMSFTGPLSTLTNDELDILIQRLREHYGRAGVTMIDGMLRSLGYRLPRECIRESLMRIDPVRRVFQQIQIRRRVYSVPGPNALWHHDGQHGMPIDFLTVLHLIFFI